LPVRRNATARSGCRLVHGVMQWWCKTWSLHVVVSPVVVEPVLPWLEAGDDRMARGLRVPRAMLRGRLVAAADVAASRAASEVKPPPSDLLTLFASRAARCRLRIDRIAGHDHILRRHCDASPCGNKYAQLGRRRRRADTRCGPRQFDEESCFVRTRSRQPTSAATSFYAPA
jgi:hypothetical protein